MKSLESFKKNALKNPAVRAEYQRLAAEFALAQELVGARAGATLSQKEVAQRMGTSQSAVARMESGRSLPSTSSLVKYARAVGRRVEIKLTKPAARGSEKQRRSGHVA